MEFEIVECHELTDSHRRIFADLLKKQNKVRGDLYRKADRCKFICFALFNGKVVAIGAIKQKTASNFNSDKANVPELSESFVWELGYLYTEEGYQGQGIAGQVTQVLLQYYGDGNLMASTEISTNPNMVKILEKNGFRIFGHPWQSAIHDNYLGLFLRFK